MATRFFHEDLLQQILVRLPVKSLLRFRCVCRSWYALISSPSFISAHVRLKNEIKSYHVLLRSFIKGEGNKLRYKVCQDNETLDEIIAIDFPFVSQHNVFFRMVGCVNGLVCLSDDLINDTDRLILWNPVIRRSLTLPRHKMDVDSTDVNGSICGLGFDPFSNEYKVVRIVYHKNQRVEGHLAEASTAVFRLSSGCWNVKSASLIPLLDSRQAYLNGVIHFKTYNNTIMGFDVRSEEFGQMMLPHSLQVTEVTALTIAAWCDMLSIFEAPYGSGTVCLWVMKDYGILDSWAKQFVIETFGFVKSLRRNGNIILQSYDGKLVTYNTKTNLIDGSELPIEGHVRGFHLKSYMESLVLLDQPDAAQGGKEYC